MLRRKRRRLIPTANSTEKSAATDETFDTLDEHTVDDGGVMDDTLAAIHLLLGRYHSGFTAMKLPSLVFWHQLYIYRMRNEGLIMTLRITLQGPPATAILLTKDYIAYMLQYSEQHRATRIFAKGLPSLTSTPTVSKAAIVDAIQQLFHSKKRPPLPATVLDEDIRHLVQAGFLVTTTALDAQEEYSFGLPRLGLFITSVVKARAAITALLNRAQYKEMLEVDMKKRKLTCSRLPMDFHLLDMEGVDLIRRLVSGSTCVVRLGDA
ncbi:hypothetical protein LEN26_018267 [Aphanomyces euteiches]|nr:hypothetical protein LEN26_018267 [Aphanomyces euteiches]KAH9115019.1 hypothetical protein AeMF1_010938 [Aphanomyces euteiches]